MKNGSSFAHIIQNPTIQSQFVWVLCLPNGIFGTILEPKCITYFQKRQIANTVKPH